MKNRGPGEFRSDNELDRGDQVHVSREQRRKGPPKYGLEGQGSAQARTKRVKIHARTDQKRKGPRKRGPGG